MKRYLRVLAFIVLHCSCANAQWVSIPDTNFGTWLNTNGYTACLQGNNTTGWQMDTTCNKVVTDTLIDMNYGFSYPNSLRIKDLTGIQYFDNLTVLDCSNHQINSLSVLPKRLASLSCYSNRMSSLPVLPNNLNSLNCADNRITSLPALPNSLTALSCAINLLSTLPELPDSLYYCSVSKNALICLPQLKRIVKLYFSDTPIACLPNYGNVSQSTPALNTLPLCDSANNSNGCQIFSSVSSIPNPQSEFRIHPNPASDNITISIDDNLLGSTATLTDLTGRRMMAVQLSTVNRQLSTADFASGVYFVTVTASDGRSVTKKLVIQK
jgi:hypothetical protein